MKEDTVKRLYNYAVKLNTVGEYTKAALVAQAADEIDALRIEVSTLEKTVDDFYDMSFDRRDE